MEERKFHRTTLRLVVLSEEPIAEFGLAELDYEMRDGRYLMGNFSQWPDIISHEELTGPEMAQACLDAASDPDFFMLTPEGVHQDDLEEAADGG